MKILLVDDEIDCVNSIEMAIKPLKHEISKYTDPFQAFDAIKLQHFDLVISDIRMPGMTGIELLKKIKEYDKRIEVIIMTAYGDLDTAIQCVNNRAYAFFPKPIEIIEVIHTIQELDRDINKSNGDDEFEAGKIKEEYNTLKKSYNELLEYLKKMQESGKINE